MLRQTSPKQMARKLARLFRAERPDYRYKYALNPLDSKSLATYRDLALADVSPEYQEAMKAFPLR